MNYIHFKDTNIYKLVCKNAAAIKKLHSNDSAVIPSGATSLTVDGSAWEDLSQVPIFQIIDTTTGNNVDITADYIGMVGPDYIPTSIVFDFGAGLPNDFLIILK